MNKLKKVYTDAFRIYTEKNPSIPKERYPSHLSRLFRYAVELKRMDFISKNCLNPLFREALILNGYKKSVEFMDEVKNAYKEDKFYFNEGILIFQEEQNE